MTGMLPRWRFVLKKGALPKHLVANRPVCRPRRRGCNLKSSLRQRRRRLTFGPSFPCSLIIGHLLCPKRVTSRLPAATPTKCESKRQERLSLCR